MALALWECREAKNTWDIYTDIRIEELRTCWNFMAFIFKISQS